MAQHDRQLTPKEQIVVNEFEKMRPGTGAIAKNNIVNNDQTGWADIIADTPDEELKATEGFSSNSFMYKRLG
ncbi:hypothetical protein NOS3756_27290 [Nostoc sp. NIES-3756]|uniref:hypothetical protein n=1 Tax=Nostoc sp. NIES-3756 TaxID=1751286 RepID=UPI000721D3B9|nr:hypothetical protein [Nostoc sp. NIES-3756]BAT53766.1 hypothetical protein NOS3756_27290 [Nostoc sp. NIES-3756]